MTATVAGPTTVDATQPSTEATTGTSTAAIVAATVTVFVLVLLGMVFFCQRSTNAETGDHPEFADLTVDEHPAWYAAFAPDVSPFEPTLSYLWGSFSSRVCSSIQRSYTIIIGSYHTIPVVIFVRGGFALWS